MRLLDSPVYREDVARVAALALDWERLRGTHLVLSGASGLIGSFLTDVVMHRNRRLGMDCTVYAVARSSVGLAERFAEYDGEPNLVLTSADVTAGVTGIDRADWVVHAASNTHPRAYAEDPVGTITANVQGTLAMLELARRTGARRTVFCSTVEIYGENRGDVERFRESDLGYIDCNTLRAGYPESKRTGEALCQAFRSRYGLDVVIPRLPRVFGPSMKQTDTKALSQFLMNAVAGQDITLKSEGRQFFSYCHVADAVGAILTCLLAGEPGEAYNVADPSCDIRLADLARLVAGTVGQDVVFDLPDEVERRGFSTATLAVMDGAKIAGLGWAPMYDMATGIARTVEVLKSVIGDAG